MALLSNYPVLGFPDILSYQSTQIFLDPLSISVVCFSHPQGGRDESNYLDDALMRQDAQVSRTAASFFFSFDNKTGQVGGHLLIFQ